MGPTESEYETPVIISGVLYTEEWCEGKTQDSRLSEILSCWVDEDWAAGVSGAPDSASGVVAGLTSNTATFTNQNTS